MINTIFEKKLVYILHHEQYFGQSLPTFKSMDLDTLESEFKFLGAIVCLLSYEELSNHKVEIDAVYITGSHQNPSVKSYIDDVLDIKFSGLSNLYPNSQLVKAHENKGYQGLLARRLGVEYVEQDYFIESKELTKKSVIKSIGGAGSAGVALASDTLALKKFFSRLCRKELTIHRALYILRAWFNKKIKNGEFANQAWEYYRPRSKYVVQNYIKNLSSDLKVLVFGKKVFVLKRSTKNGDFRASGSGLFDFVEASDELLDFVYRQKKILDTPYVSMDVVSTELGYKCIEYQCAHFGPYTQIKAPYYYKLTDDVWKKLPNDTILEKLIVESIADMISLSR